jgi:hypothetical protein
MREFLKQALIAVVLSAAAESHAATLIVVIPVHGSLSTEVYGINDSDVIAGGYTKSFPPAGYHGFFGTLADGKYTSFDFGPGGTFARAIDDNGDITGFSNVGLSNHCLFLEFERAPDGSIAAITKDGKRLLGIPEGLNARGEFVGDYCRKNGTIAGYYGAAAQYTRSLRIGIAAPAIAPRAINSKGDVAGFYVDADTGQAHGFLLRKRIATVIDYPDPNAQGTFLTGMNDHGLVSGSWLNGSTHVYGAFLFDTEKSNFTPIVVPGAKFFTEAEGMNSKGLTAVVSDQGPFVYCPLKTDKCPKRGVEVAESIIHVPPATFRSYRAQQGQ